MEMNITFNVYNLNELHKTMENNIYYYPEKN